jgi:YVTN family beta-propeller protein
VCAEPEGIAVANDGAQVYVACEAVSTVGIIDTASNRIVAEIKTGLKPRRFAVPPAGKEVWVTAEAAGEVQVLDVGVNAVVATLRFEPPGVKREDVRPVGIAMRADGRRAFVGLSRAEVVAVVDVGKRQVEAYWAAGKRPWNVAVSRDGARLFVANAQSDDLSILDAGTGRAASAVKVGRSPHSVLVDD